MYVYQFCRYRAVYIFHATFAAHALKAEVFQTPFA